MKITLRAGHRYQDRCEWFLRESDEEENNSARDLIPWPWSLRFTLLDMRLFASVTAKNILTADGREDNEISEREFIAAKLTPTDVSHWHFNGRTSHSMVGTNRQISNFEPWIQKIEKGEIESCLAWGDVSDTDNVDFHKVVYNDVLIFYLNIDSERFAQYTAKIRDQSTMSATLRVGGVAGFYSDWSPDIYTYFIKVLTQDQEHHPVDIPEGCEIIPPRLGRISELELCLSGESRFKLPTSPNTNDDLEDDSINSANRPQEAAQTPLSQSVFSDANTLTLLKSLRVAMWIITAFLFLILIKLVLPT